MSAGSVSTSNIHGDPFGNLRNQRRIGIATFGRQRASAPAIGATETVPMKPRANMVR